MKTPKLGLILLGLAFLAGCFSPRTRESDSLRNWPAESSPKVVGKRIVANFLPRKFRYETNPQKAHLGVIYPEAITWYGALTWTQWAGDSNLTTRLIEKFEPLLSDEGNTHINRSAHVDYRVFGIVPFEIFLETGDQRCLRLGLELADAQWARTTADGITAEARYWIDDMYMIPAVQTQAYRATGDQKYLDRAALAMASYLDKLQQPNGLFFHGKSAPFYWGRGNGWMAAGATELLRSLPVDHPRYERIMSGYHKMMAALLAAQDANGMWHQLIDHPEAWPETSGSAMFAFAFVTGVKHGWLDEAVYGPAARRAWLGLTSYLDEQGNLREVCVGTDKADKVVGANLDAQLKFYLDRPRAVGDLHGQAPMLWTATALLRSENQ